MALAVVSTLALSTPLVGSAVAAPASPHGPRLPSEEEVTQAQQDVAAKQASVAQLQNALASAQVRLEETVQQAEVAAERYNGALWRLSEAQKQKDRAHRAAVQRADEVEQQRTGIITLVTESYQNGTDLNTATALISDEGPNGLMNRYAVVQSAGDSMEAQYSRFRATSAVAKAYAAKADKMADRQRSMADEARTLAQAAGQAAVSASTAANQIAVQKQELNQALATAQNISVELATKRQNGLEKIAAEKAAALAAAQAAARAQKAQEAQAAEKAKLKKAQLKKAVVEARRKASSAKADVPTVDHRDSGGGSSPAYVPLPVSAPPPVVNPAPNAATGVQRAIAYAKAQIGLPYQWAAAGPYSFDCSGLTMQAWGRGGKTLPHYSVAQFSQSQRVAMSDLRAGDLLFWSNNGSPSGIHHVALYIGGGQFIEAPHTGANVRYNSIYTWYPDFAARP